MYEDYLIFVEKFVVHRCDPLKCGVFYITTPPSPQKNLPSPVYVRNGYQGLEQCGPSVLIVDLEVAIHVLNMPL
jgi:hypothetical protein